ncbi:hypothetical protein MD484_g3152, partial [Candolleomyces efflorescens]
MRYSGLTLLTIGAVASQVAGGIIEARSSLEFVFRRQGTAVCTTECSAFQNSLEICETTSCLCTTSVSASLNRCVNCYYQESSTTAVEAAANRLISSYNDACAGVPGLPPVSITGAPGGISTTSTTSTSRTLLPTASTTVTSASQTRVTGTFTTIEPPATQTIIRAPTTTAGDGAATTVTAPNNTGLPGLGSGAQSLSAAAYPVVMVVALAMGAFVL